MTARPWSVVRLTGGAEFAVAGAMLAAGFEAYCPAYTTRRPNRYGHRGEMIEVSRPLFPSYLFVRIQSGLRREAFETGRIKLRIFHRTRLSEAVIDVVRATAQEASKIAVERKIMPGDFTTLLRGVLRGESAKVLMVRGQKAIVEIMRAGRAAVLRVRLTDLTLEVSRG